jgi:hypothetical protein
MSTKIKIIAWSDSCGEYQYWGEADSKESALLKIKAMNHDPKFYKFEESKTFGRIGEDGKIKTERAERTVKEVPPESTACIFWLKNRQPTKWRDKTDLNVFDGEAQIDRDEKARVMREEMIKKFSVDES